MRPRGRMTFCKAVYGKGRQFGSVIKTEDLNYSLQSLRRFERSPDASFLPAPAPHFFQSLVRADIASSSTWSSFFFHLFHPLLNHSGGIMTWTPWLKTIWPLKFPVSPLVCFCSTWKCSRKLFRQHFREALRGQEEVWSKQPGGFPCARHSSLRNTPGCGAALGRIPNYTTFYGLWYHTNSHEPPNETWELMLPATHSVWSYS